MAVQVFDDGSTLTTDASGNITAATDSSGNPVPVSSVGGGAFSSIVSSFSSLFNYGVLSAINSKYGAQNAQTQVAVASAQSSQYMKLAVVAVIGLIAYQMVKK